MTDKAVISLEVQLKDKGPSDKGGHRIAFEVKNVGGAPARVCRYHTPLEGFYANFLDVRAAGGAAAPYLGIMVKRGEPKDADYTVIPPGETVSADFNLAEGYDISAKGRFTVQFRGNAKLNALPDSNVLEITVK